MRSADVFVDGFGRVQGLVHSVLDGLGPEQLGFRADADANPIGWLVWHLTRVQDDHVADAAGSEQVWTAGGWVERFGLPYDRMATGYGQSSRDVAALHAAPELLLGYHDAVHARTVEYVSGLDDAALDRIVDTRWDPPVTLGVRLVSVIGDDLQHAGQAAYVKGITQRAG